jgi:hypothetical protein
MKNFERPNAKALLALFESSFGDGWKITTDDEEVIAIECKHGKISFLISAETGHKWTWGASAYNEETNAYVFDVYAKDMAHVERRFAHEVRVYQTAFNAFSAN